jgi:hypothetical protein
MNAPMTKEAQALGAFLAAMHDSNLDGAEMRKAMLSVLGSAAQSAPVGYALVSLEELADWKNRVNTLAGLSTKAERYAVGGNLKAIIADVIETPVPPELASTAVAQAEPVARDEPTENDWADFGAWTERDKGARDMLEKLIDVWDDGQSPHEHRCYVDGAWTELIAEARSLLAASAAQPRPQPRPQPLTDEQIMGIAKNPMTAPCSPWWLKDDVVLNDVQNAAKLFTRAIEQAHGITAQEPTE